MYLLNSFTSHRAHVLYPIRVNCICTCAATSKCYHKSDVIILLDMIPVGTQDTLLIKHANHSRLAYTCLYSRNEMHVMTGIIPRGWG